MDAILDSMDIGHLCHHRKFCWTGLIQRSLGGVQWCLNPDVLWCTHTDLYM